MNSRWLRGVLLWIYAAGFSAAQGAEVTELPSLLVDRVWSGHPVSFAFVTERGHQFVAYYDAERRITVAGRRVGEAGWTRIQPSGTPMEARQRASNVTGWDSHNYLRLALDREGCVHLSGNMHNDPLVYYRTRVPFDLSTLERVDWMTGERETRCTYPVFFKNAEGDLFFRYRDGGSGNGSDLYNRYDVTTRAWERVLATALIDGEGQRNAYALDPRLGPDGRFHLVWMWRDTPDCATNHDLSYARSRDLVHWENSRGEALPLPLTLHRAEVIDPAQPHEGLINMTFNLGFTAEHRPVVIYHRYDREKRSQVFAATPQAEGGWAISQVSRWTFCWAFSGTGSIPAEVTLGAPRMLDEHFLSVDYSSVAVGAGRWRIDARTLAPVGELPAVPPVLPLALLRAQDAASEMEVQTLITQENGRRYVLRWETLPRNRDEPREVAPPPTELRVYEVEEGESSDAARIGS